MIALAGDSCFTSSLQRVALSDGKTQSISSSLEVRSGFSVVDCKGKYLCPSLFDTHVHFCMSTSAPCLASAIYPRPLGNSRDVSLLRKPYVAAHCGLLACVTAVVVRLWLSKKPTLTVSFPILASSSRATPCPSPADTETSEAPTMIVCSAAADTPMAWAACTVVFLGA